jgi:hypothetical protein
VKKNHFLWRSSARRVALPFTQAKFAEENEMSPPQGQAKRIFLDAVEIPSLSQRQAYLVAECGDDEALRREVEALLAHHGGMGSFLESPATALAATADEPTWERPGTIIGQ